MLQRRHFEMIAEVIRAMDLEYPSRRIVALDFAEALEDESNPETNRRFDRARFLDACRVLEEEVA